MYNTVGLVIHVRRRTPSHADAKLGQNRKEWSRESPRLSVVPCDRHLKNFPRWQRNRTDARTRFWNFVNLSIYRTRWMWFPMTSTPDRFANRTRKGQRWQLSSHRGWPSFGIHRITVLAWLTGFHGPFALVGFFSREYRETDFTRRTKVGKNKRLLYLRSSSHYKTTKKRTKNWSQNQQRAPGRNGSQTSRSEMKLLGNFDRPGRGLSRCHFYVVDSLPLRPIP